MTTTRTPAGKNGTSKASSTAARKPVAHFDIAQAEKAYEDGLDQIEPFVVRMSDGDVVTFRDPRVIGWQVLASFDLSQPYGIIRELLTEEDFDTFIKEDFPPSILREMIEAHRDHYGIQQGN